MEQDLHHPASCHLLCGKEVDSDGGLGLAVEDKLNGVALRRLLPLLISGTVQSNQWNFVIRIERKMKESKKEKKKIYIPKVEEYG